MPKTIIIMTKESFMSTLYNNSRNLTIEVLDYACMNLRFEVKNGNVTLRRSEFPTPKIFYI